MGVREAGKTSPTRDVHGKGLIPADRSQIPEIVAEPSSDHLESFDRSAQAKDQSLYCSPDEGCGWLCCPAIFLLPFYHYQLTPTCLCSFRIQYDIAYRYSKLADDPKRPLPEVIYVGRYQNVRRINSIRVLDCQELIIRHLILRTS